MGSKRLDSISDYARHGLDLMVECRRCNRVTIISARKLSEECHRTGRSRDMGFIERRLRCQKCRGRNVRCGPITTTLIG